MKKILISLVCALVLITVPIGGCASQAFFGNGAQVIASNVSMIKTGLKGQKIGFKDADFKSALAIKNFKSITITDIPTSTEGTLLLSGRRVGVGKVIKRKNIGSLVFLPASDSVTECNFSFTLDGYSSDSQIKCVLKLIDRVNYAPRVDGDSPLYTSVSTQQSIGVYGSLHAEDPENDELEYIVFSYPEHGVLELDKSDGEYCYTPLGEYTGRDSFRFVVRDEYGNYSEPVTVSLNVTKRMCDTEYRDMESRSEYNAAVAMTAMGVMNGKLLGDMLYFNPDESVSRAEFVAMAMKCAGIRADSTIARSFFDDDSEIPEALRGYVATAQRIGLINGDFKDGRLVFSPNSPITGYEAASVLAKIVGESDNAEEDVFAEYENIPVWAVSGVSAMYVLGIFNEKDAAAITDTVTRASAASYLYRLTYVL